ncbi:copper amine oxidase N-terminal domain-containing protein [Bacillus tianshenii]|nr:copper amine oxidase N-terminal domain-containing protein [Bacillus tianshenii]
MKRYFIMVFALLFVLFAPTNETGAMEKETLNGGVIINSKTLVPMRGIFESLGATVNWDGSTKTISGVKGQKTIILQINNKTAKINGSKTSLSVPPKVINQKTMIPLRFVAESLGAQVNWDKENSQAIITTAEKTIIVNVATSVTKSYLNDPTKIYVYQSMDGHYGGETWMLMFERHERGAQIWKGIFSDTTYTYYFAEDKESLFIGFYESDGDIAIKYPAKVGQTWTTGYEGETSTNTIISTNATIKTPAGTFNNVVTVKDSDGYYSYYAPNVGRVATKRMTENGLATTSVLKELR